MAVGAGLAPALVVFVRSREAEVKNESTEITTFIFSLLYD